MNGNPPYWALRFLRWFCREDYLSEIEGDLVELHHLRSKQSPVRAHIFFVWNVIRSLRPMNMKHLQILKSTGMLKNYFKIGYRSLLKDLRFSSINLLGLSIGLCVFLIMTIMVKHELSFDSFHTKRDRIFEVIQVFQNADGDDPEIWTSLKLSEALRNDLTIVENAVTIHGASSTWAEADGKRFFEEDGIVAGPQFFEIFDFKKKLGNKNVLKNKRSIVLSEELATKYFGFEDPIGKVVELDYYGAFTVTGVIEDVPTNSFIQFNFIITQDYDVFFENVATWFPDWFVSWEGDPAATYVLLKDAADKELFEEQAADLLRKNLGPDKEINPHYLLSMNDLHFNSHGIDGRINEYVKGDAKKIQFMIGIAIVILIMACLNYINISTARYIKRTKEVGVRKAMGAQKVQVTYQFLIESFMMVLVSFSIGLMLAYLLLPYFNELIGIKLALDQELLLSLAPALIGTVILVTLLAGFYPAFHLSRFQVVNVLKNSTISTKGNGLLRKSLVTVQYTFVIIIMVALLVVNQQYSYMSEKSLGFSSDNLLIVEVNSGGVRENFELIKNEIRGLPDVEKVTGFTRVISGYRSGSSIEVNELEQPDERYSMRFYGMDADGLSTMKLELVRGSDFVGQESVDRNSVMLNETAAQKLGGEQIIGSFIEIESEEKDVLKARVIGIIRDFHHQSLHSSIVPLVIGYYKNPIIGLDDIVIKLSGNNVIATLDQIEKIHNTYDVNDVMTWEFMDKMIQDAYEKELMFRDVFMGASIVSFLIALLGMIGLTSYSVNSRTKEIGIRKILGATFLSIINMEARSLVRFLIIASLVSAPICWWIAGAWLANFEYRIDPSPMLFALVVLFILIATFLVSYFIGRKIASAPSADSIRYE